MGQAQINVRTRACSGTFIARTKQAALTHNVRGKRLMKLNMPAVFIRLLLDSYLNQRICAAWGACKSDFFQATNGVKQGSIISPILFTVYVDELITRLQARGLGCNIGRSYIGVLGYADDLTLLTPSGNRLSNMVGICEEYAKEYDIVFNCKKTVGIHYTVW